MKKLNKIFCADICLTSRKSILVIIIILFSTFLLASVWPNSIKENNINTSCDDEEIWIPTEEDIAYQDSMYTIIQNTQNDITDIKEDIVYIIERLDYKDGTFDSIRYVKGSEIDLRMN